MPPSLVWTPAWLALRVSTVLHPRLGLRSVVLARTHPMANLNARLAPLACSVLVVKRAL